MGSEGCLHHLRLLIIVPTFGVKSLDSGSISSSIPYSQSCIKLERVEKGCGGKSILDLGHANLNEA